MHSNFVFLTNEFWVSMIILYVCTTHIQDPYTERRSMQALKMRLQLVMRKIWSLTCRLCCAAPSCTSADTIGGIWVSEPPITLKPKPPCGLLSNLTILSSAMLVALTALYVHLVHWLPAICSTLEPGHAQWPEILTGLMHRISTGRVK